MASRRDMDPTAFDAEFTLDYRNALDFENSKHCLRNANLFEFFSYVNSACQ